MNKIFKNFLISLCSFGIAPSVLSTEQQSVIKQDRLNLTKQACRLLKFGYSPKVHGLLSSDIPNTPQAWVSSLFRQGAAFNQQFADIFLKTFGKALTLYRLTLVRHPQEAATLMKLRNAGGLISILQRIGEEAMLPPDETSLLKKTFESAVSTLENALQEIAPKTLSREEADQEAS